MFLRLRAATAGGGAPDTAQADEGAAPQPMFKEQSDSRSRSWQRVYGALMKFDRSSNDDDFEVHPETDARVKLEKLIFDPKYRGEVISSKGFIVGKSLLHVCCERGAMKCLTLLLENGASVDTPDKYRDTPLHIAASKNQVEVVEELLASGAALDILNKHGKTAEEWADFFGNTGCSNLIRQAGGRSEEEIALPRGISAELAEDLMLSAKQIASYKEAFDLFDEDKSGELDHSELGMVIRSIGFQISEKEVDDMMFEADEDGSGALDFLEFLELMARRFGDLDVENTEEAQQKTLEEIVKALRAFDRDRSGCLSHGEFMNAMMKYGEPLTDSQAEEITTFIDLSGGQEIDCAELAEILAKK